MAIEKCQIMYHLWAPELKKGVSSQFSHLVIFILMILIENYLVIITAKFYSQKLFAALAVKRQGVVMVGFY